MGNLANALAWFDLGLPVFPCYEVDTWVDTNLHARKAPRTNRGFYDSFTSREQVVRYWTQHPEHLVGVWCKDILVVLDVDNDPEQGIDGQFELDESGVVPPVTHSVITPRGGSHHFYLKPEGIEVGPDANIVLPNGTVLKGVDRRAGNSYFIAWSDDVPVSFKELAPAPDWLLSPSRNAETSPFSGSDREWFDSLALGEPDERVLKAVARIPEGEFAHDEMRDRQLELVRLGAEGHPGVVAGLWELKSRWLTAPWDQPEWENDWNASLRGAIRKFGAFEALTPSADFTEAYFEAKVQKRLLEMKINLEAESLLAAEGSRETVLVTLEELASLKQEYLVSSLVPRKNGIVVLVAKRSQGKTFAYIDMVLAMVFEMLWMGKATQQAKVLIVLGEGQHGFYERLSAWCDYHSKPIEEVGKWVHFVTGVNLNSPVALTKLGEYVRQLHTEFVVIDTWAATSGLPDEDKAAFVSRTLNKLEDSVGDTTVLITHHPNKSSEDAKRLVPRGSGAFEGRADVVISLQPDSSYRSRGGLRENWLSLSTEAERGGKNRGAAQETIRGAYLKPHGSSQVWVVDPSSLVRDGTAHVLEHLKGSTTVKAYVEKTKVSTSTARRYLDDAVEDGVVEKSKGRNPSEPYVYSLSVAELGRLAPDNL